MAAARVILDFWRDAWVPRRLKHVSCGTLWRRWMLPITGETYYFLVDASYYHQTGF